MGSGFLVCPLGMPLRVLAVSRRPVLKQLDVNGVFQYRIEALERRVALDGTTSSLPPANGGLKKSPAERPTRSQRGISGRKSGGQPGHKGGNAATDADADAGPCDQPQPGNLQRLWRGTHGRHGGTFPWRVRWLTRRFRHHLRRRSIGRIHAGVRGVMVKRARFREDVKGPVQHGSRIWAVAGDLQAHHCLPEDRPALLVV